MQKIVLFIEPRKYKWSTPFKIGNLFMNRFSIDEDGCDEILKIHYLDNTYEDYEDGKLTQNEGPDRLKQQNNYKTWKLKLETKLSLKGKYEFGNKNDLETKIIWNHIGQLGNKIKMET